MADYYSQFATKFDLPTPELADELVDKLNKVNKTRDLDIENIEADQTSVYFHGDYGIKEHLSDLLSNFLLLHNLDMAIIIGVAYFCNKPRPNEFGGYAVRITKDDVVAIDAIEEALKL